MRMVIRLALAMSASAVAFPSAAQTDPKALAEAFGAREYIGEASLSPDGTQLAYITALNGAGSGLAVLDMQTQGKVAPTTILVADGRPEQLSSCEWASNSRLLCNVYSIAPLPDGQIAYMSRIVAVDRDGKNMKVLENSRGAGNALGFRLFGGNVIDWSPGQDGHVLMIRQYVPEQTTGTHMAQTREGFGVDDVDSTNLRSRSVEVARRDAREFISDGKGHVQIMGLQPLDSAGYDRVLRRYHYRPKAGGSWKLLSVVDGTHSGFDPYLVDPVGDTAYGLKSKDGRIAAYSKTLDDSAAETLLFAHPQVDVDGFATIGRSRRAIGVSYATDKREIFYFDAEMEKLAKSLSRALPNLPLVRIIDASQDEGKLLIWAGSDVDPGRYYLLDRNGKRMEQLLAIRPQLEGKTLAQVKPVSYPAADGTMIPGYLTLPPGGPTKGLPAIVMPHGGPGARDEWGFDWLAQYYASLGYAVLQPNFRGSTGYGDVWFEKNGFRSWRTAIGDVDDGGRWLVKEGIAKADKLAIVGWSYGGYAALQSAVTEPRLFKAVIAIAPVTDLDRLREERAGWSDYAKVSAYIGSGAHVADGSPARHAEAVKVPVLMFHGTLDRNVGVRQSRLMDDRLKKAGASSDLVIYEGLDHYLNDSSARTDMLKRSADFLSKALGS